MNTLARDLRYALRAFRKSPGFTAAAVLSLAIGIGANTAIFSITSALLLRPLPYKDAGRLVILWNTSPGLGITQDWFPPRSTLISRMAITALSRSRLPSAGTSISPARVILNALA